MGNSITDGEHGAVFGEDKHRETHENFKRLEERLKGLSDTTIVKMGGSPFVSRHTRNGDG